MVLAAELDKFEGGIEWSAGTRRAFRQEMDAWESDRGIDEQYVESKDLELITALIFCLSKLAESEDHCGLWERSVSSSLAEQRETSGRRW